MPGPGPILAAERDGARARFALQGEIDMTARFVADQALEALLEPLPEILEIDLTEVTFIDSTGVGLVLEAGDRARREGFGLRIVPGPRPVQRVFEVAGLVDVLPFV